MLYGRHTQQEKERDAANSQIFTECDKLSKSREDKNRLQEASDFCFSEKVVIRLTYFIIQFQEDLHILFSPS